jgi:hypothetical protein
VALKFSPPLSDETVSLSRPLLSTMMICVGLKLPMGLPSTTELERFTVPKSASGRTPPLPVQHGASMMTSAEERAALARVWVVLTLQFWVASARVSLNSLLPS